MKFQITHWLLFFAILFPGCISAKKVISVKDNATEIKVLIVNGQNNHNWKIGSNSLQKIMEGAGLFTVEIATSPEKGKDMSDFKPNFQAFDVVVMDYNGDEWCDETKTSFVSYVRNGGGLVIFHAADNSFPKWKEYNQMIGLGGWGQRNESAGPYVYMQDDGKIIRDNTPGKGGSHGPQHDYTVKTREPNHPIMKGLPEEWLHAKDELYHGLRGPAENMTILATAYSDTTFKGTGRHEPALMTINYGKGRVFHTILGHASEANLPIKCAGFIVTFLRGTEWAATGKVKQAIPEKLTTKTEVRLWEDYKK